MSNLQLYCKTFQQLSTDELYAILALRQEVFILEQNCLFTDIDFKDQFSLHCLAYFEGQLVAYTRLFDENKYYQNFTSIGRVVGSPKARGQGFGKTMFAYSIEKIYENFGQKPIKIGAQAYLENFYNTFGFKSIDEDYIEDGIPHKLMVK